MTIFSVHVTGWIRPGRGHPSRQKPTQSSLQAWDMEGPWPVRSMHVANTSGLPLHPHTNKQTGADVLCFIRMGGDLGAATGGHPAHLCQVQHPWALSSGIWPLSTLLSPLTFLPLLPGSFLYHPDILGRWSCFHESNHWILPLSQHFDLSWTNYFFFAPMLDIQTVFNRNFEWK